MFSDRGLICPACGQIADDDGSLTVKSGSFPLGFLAGFFGGCIGFILVRMFARGKSTKRGAGVGFFAQLLFSAIVRMASWG